MNFTAHDFQLTEPGRSVDDVGDALRLSGVELSENVFKNSDCMMDVTKLGARTYYRFVLNGNRMENPEEGEHNGAIIRFYFSQRVWLGFDGWTVNGNRVGLGPVIDLDYREEPNMKKYQERAGLTITNSLFVNNTSTGKAALFVLDHDLPWLRILFRSATLSGNIGTITNDFFARNIRRLDFIRSAWRQRRREPSETPVKTTAKFIVFDRYDYELNVESSAFDCQMDLDRSHVFTLNHNKTDEGEAPVFKFVMPFQETFYADRDLRAENERINAEPSHYWKALSCTRVEAGEARGDPQRKYKCKRGMWQWRFVGNDFNGCQQGTKGGIFHLTNGAKVNITGRANTADENSALYGGFAYLRGVDTEMLVRPAETLPTSPASNWHSRPKKAIAERKKNESKKAGLAKSRQGKEAKGEDKEDEEAEAEMQKQRECALDNPDDMFTLWQKAPVKIPERGEQWELNEDDEQQPPVCWEHDSSRRQNGSALAA